MLSRETIYPKPLEASSQNIFGVSQCQSHYLQCEVRYIVIIEHLTDKKLQNDKLHMSILALTNTYDRGTMADSIFQVKAEHNSFNSLCNVRHA